MDLQRGSGSGVIEAIAMTMTAIVQDDALAKSGGRGLIPR